MVLFPKTYTLKGISSEGYYDSSGEYIEGVITPLNFIADIQPLSNKEIESLNVGRKEKGKIKIFTDRQLNISIMGDNGKNLQNGDKVIFNNFEYEIILENKHQNDVINHFEYIGEII